MWYTDILAVVCNKRSVREDSRKWRCITMGEYRKYWSEPMETLSPEGFYEVQTRALLKELDYVWKRSLFYQEKSQ